MTSVSFRTSRGAAWLCMCSWPSRATSADTSGAEGVALAWAQRMRRSGARPTRHRLARMVSGGDRKLDRDRHGDYIGRWYTGQVATAPACSATKGQGIGIDSVDFVGRQHVSRRTPDPRWTVLVPPCSLMFCGTNAAVAAAAPRSPPCTRPPPRTLPTVWPPAGPLLRARADEQGIRGSAPANDVSLGFVIYPIRVRAWDFPARPSASAAVPPTLRLQCAGWRIQRLPRSRRRRHLRPRQRLAAAAAPRAPPSTPSSSTKRWI